MPDLRVLDPETPPKAEGASSPRKDWVLAPWVFARIVAAGPYTGGELLLGSLRDRRLRVKTPIQIKIETENDQFIAEAAEYNEFGFGDNPWAALADLQHALVELYFELERQHANLGRDLRGIWEKLTKNIEKAHD